MTYEMENRLYRSRRGLIFGVCRGVGEYLNVSVFWTRILLIVGFIFTGFFPLGALYIVAALLMKPEPRWHAAESGPFRKREPRDHSPGTRLRQSFESLDRRLQRLESVVTDPVYDWDRRLRDS